MKVIVDAPCDMVCKSVTVWPGESRIRVADTDICDWNSEQAMVWTFSAPVLVLKGVRLEALNCLPTLEIR